MADNSRAQSINQQELSDYELEQARIMLRKRRQQDTRSLDPNDQARRCRKATIGLVLL